MRFTPDESGVYMLYVFLHGVLMSDTPKQIDVCDPKNVKASGPGLGHQQGARRRCDR